MRDRLIKGSFWAVLSRVLAIGLGVVTNALLARMLSPAEMGAYFLAISIITAFSTLAQIGLPQVVVRLVAESISLNLLGRAKQVIEKSILLVCLSGAILALLFYFIIGNFLATYVLHSNNLQLIVGMVATSILVISLQGVVTEAFRGLHDLRTASLVSSVITSVIFVSSLVFLWINAKHLSLQQVFLLTLVSSVATLFISSTFLGTKFSDINERGITDYKDLIFIGWPLCIINLTIFIATQADLWIAGAFLYDKDVAIYGAVQRLLLLMTMTHTLVVSVAQSSVAELYIKAQKEKLQTLIQGFTFAACLPAAVILVTLLFFGADILEFIFSEYYRKGFNSLLVLALGQFVSMLLGPGDMVLMMTGFQKQLMLLIVLTSVIRVVLGIALTHNIGLLGLATAWAVGAIVQSLLVKSACFKLTGVKTNVDFVATVKLLQVYRNLK